MDRSRKGFTSGWVAVLGVILLLVVIIIPTRAQNLTAVECKAKLPTTRRLSAALYDHEDTIYIFGGFRWGVGGNPDVILKETLKYSISRDTIEVVAQLPIPCYGGGAIMNKHGDIFYLAGTGYCKRDAMPILQYFPAFKNFSIVSTVVGGSSSSATVILDEDTVGLFGGECNKSLALILDMNTFAYERMEHYLVQREISPAAVSVGEQGVAYLFSTTGPYKYVQKYSRFTNNSEILPIRVPELVDPTGISDGKHGYIIGLMSPYENSIAQFDPVTEDFSYIPVEGYPGTAGIFFSTTAVYVEKLNRIYIFGGAVKSSEQDKIWYISLGPPTTLPTTTASTPTVPTTTTPTTTTPTTTVPTTTDTPVTTVDPVLFNCAGRPNGLFPFPGECAKFIICKEDHGYAYDCPEDLLFHQINRQCTLPEWVDC